ncbi:capsid and scaffold protein [Xanthomonas phage XPV2]|nr:capsid and scaffold protein [Xanthomonas phage XPV2]
MSINNDRTDIKQLEKVGIIFDGYSPKSISSEVSAYAMDAVNLTPTLQTTANAGIPAWMTTFVDRRVIDIQLAPMAAAKIFPEVKKGDWTTTYGVFVIAEPVGQVATYSDWSANGMSKANVNFESRQNYRYQTWTEYGDLEMATYGEAGIDYVARQEISASLVMAKFANTSYLLGVAGIANYGLMNDPTLPAPVAATVNWATAAPEDIANDVVAMVGRLISQSGGLITGQERMVMALAPSALNNVNRTNNFGLSAGAKIAQTYPQIEFVAVPEFDTASGRLVQLWVPEVNGQPTGEVAFAEKLRSHSIERYSTTTRQKHSGATFGAVIYQPWAVTQELGV